MWDKEIVYMVWKDTKGVTAGSNPCSMQEMQMIVLRNWKEKGERKNVPLLIPIYNHNKFMGGVDYSDQML